MAVRREKEEGPLGGREGSGGASGSYIFFVFGIIIYFRLSCSPLEEAGEVNAGAKSPDSPKSVSGHQSPERSF